MALAGSSVGLGNLWRFPYMAGTYGGGAFILVYVFLVFLACLPILTAEILIGRRGQSNAFGTFRKIAPGSNWKWVGLLMVVSPITLLCYYSVVGGWSVAYFFKALCFDFTSSAVAGEQFGSVFDAFVSSPVPPIICHTIFLAITVLVVLGGVQKGIERFGKIIMPVLFLIVILIAVRGATLPGALEGFKFLFKPDFSKITPQVCVAAMGQGFFSLSTGCGTMLIYGSYLSRRSNLAKFSISTAIADFCFAIIAGCAIMPAVFAFGQSPEAGPGLLFKTLPFIFSKMPAGGIIALLFFFSLLCAALTSSISMCETGTAFLVEEKHMSRKKACLIIFLIAWVVGALCCLSFGLLSGAKIFGRTLFDFLDYLSANVLMTGGALLIVLFVGWKMKATDVWSEFTNEGMLAGNRKIFRPTYFLIKYVAPLAIVVIFISQILA